MRVPRRYAESAVLAYSISYDTTQLADAGNVFSKTDFTGLALQTGDGIRSTFNAKFA
jgi:hypothetical protein